MSNKALLITAGIVAILFAWRLIVVNPQNAIDAYKENLASLQACLLNADDVYDRNWAQSCRGEFDRCMKTMSFATCSNTFDPTPDTDDWNCKLNTDVATRWDSIREDAKNLCVRMYDN